VLICPFVPCTFCFQLISAFLGLQCSRSCCQGSVNPFSRYGKLGLKFKLFVFLQFLELAKCLYGLIVVLDA